MSIQKLVRRIRTRIQWHGAIICSVDSPIERFQHTRVSLFSPPRGAQLGSFRNWQIYYEICSNEHAVLVVLTYISRPANSLATTPTLCVLNEAPKTMPRIPPLLHQLHLLHLSTS